MQESQDQLEDIVRILASVKRSDVELQRLDSYLESLKLDFFQKIKQQLQHDKYKSLLLYLKLVSVKPSETIVEISNQIINTIFKTIDTIGRQFYVILKGCVIVLKPQGVLKSSRDIQQHLEGENSNYLQEVAEMHAGECFGEIALSQNVLRTATIVAKEPTLLLTLHKQNYDSIVEKYHKHMFELQMQFLRSVPFLSTWRTTVLANLFKSTTERIMTRGQVVYTEGAAVNSIFIIRKGIIEIRQRFLLSEIQKKTREQNFPNASDITLLNRVWSNQLQQDNEIEMVVSVLGERQHFGLAEIAAKCQKRNTRAICTSSEAALLEINRKAFESVVTDGNQYEDILRDSKIKEQWHNTYAEQSASVIKKSSDISLGLKKMFFSKILQQKNEYYNQQQNKTSGKSPPSTQRGREIANEFIIKDSNKSVSPKHIVKKQTESQQWQGVQTHTEGEEQSVAEQNLKAAFVYKNPVHLNSNRKQNSTGNIMRRPRIKNLHLENLSLTTELLTAQSYARTSAFMHQRMYTEMKKVFLPSKDAIFKVQPQIFLNVEDVSQCNVKVLKCFEQNYEEQNDQLKKRLYAKYTTQRDQLAKILESLKLGSLKRKQLLQEKQDKLRQNSSDQAANTTNQQDQSKQTKSLERKSNFTRKQYSKSPLISHTSDYFVESLTDKVPTTQRSNATISQLYGQQQEQTATTPVSTNRKIILKERGQQSDKNRRKFSKLLSRQQSLGEKIKPTSEFYDVFSNPAEQYFEVGAAPKPKQNNIAMKNFKTRKQSNIY